MVPAWVTKAWPSLKTVSSLTGMRPITVGDFSSAGARTPQTQSRAVAARRRLRAMRNPPRGMVRVTGESITGAGDSRRNEMVTTLDRGRQTIYIQHSAGL